MNHLNPKLKAAIYLIILVAILSITHPISEHLSTYLFSELLNGESVSMLALAGVLKFALGFTLFAPPAYIVYEKFYGVKNDNE